MKLGFLVPHLGPSQRAYFLVEQANAALEHGLVSDVVVFYETLSRPCLTPRFAAMQLPECWGFDGVLVATSLSGVEKLQKAPAARRRLFYVWDLEWLRLERKSYDGLRRLYASDGVDLLARSPEHARLLEEAWGRKPLGVVEDFDLAALLKLL